MLSVMSLTYQWDELNLYFEMVRKTQSLHFVIPKVQAVTLKHHCLRETPM